MANRQQVTRFATVIALTFITFLFLGNILPGSVGLNGIKSITHAPNTVPGTFVKPGSEQSRYAFVSFLGAEAAGNDTEDLSKDKYFTAVRVLAYQLLHSLETRTTHNYPFVVLVTPEVCSFLIQNDCLPMEAPGTTPPSTRCCLTSEYIKLTITQVSEKKRQRLRQDGATIVEAASFDVAEWLVSENPRFASVVSKLRVFELTQFELVCFLDGDHVLTRPLDGVFEDPTVGIKTTATNPGNIIADETPLPDSYVFATVHEMNKAHTFPFSYEDGDWPWEYVKFDTIP